MYKHGNMGNFTENELVEILNKYGTLSDNGEETILDKTLTSTDKKHEIKVNEIWDIPFGKGTVMFSINGKIDEYTDLRSVFSDWGDGSFEVPKGTTWKEFLSR